MERTVKEQGEFIWTLPNFPVLQQAKEQLLKTTAEFYIGGPSSLLSTKWKTRFSFDSRGKLQMVLQLVDHNASSNTITVTGEVWYSYTAEPGSFLSCHKLGVPVNMNKYQEFEVYLGWCVLIPVSGSFWSRQCLNGKFYVKIALTVGGLLPVGLSGKHALKEFEENSMSKLRTSLASLLANKSFSDLKIICSDGKELHANQALLSVQNPVFETMLTAGMSESKTGIVNVDDLSGGTMEVLLHYFYTGKLIAGWKKPDTIVEFVYAAGKYQISEILTMLDNVLGSDEAPECNIELISLVNKLELTNAEERLLSRFKEIVNNLSTTKELMEVCKYDGSCNRFIEFTQEGKKLKCLGPAE